MHSPLACAVHATLCGAFPQLTVSLVLPSEPIAEGTDLLVADVAPYPVVDMAERAHWGSFIEMTLLAQQVVATLRRAGFRMQAANFCIEVTDGPHA